MSVVLLFVLITINCAIILLSVYPTELLSGVHLVTTNT